MTKPSSKSNLYSRFIPREEVGDVTQWKFGAVGSDDAPEAQSKVVELPSAEEEAAHQAEQHAAQQRAMDDAFARGRAQGEAQATLAWQHKMDEYAAGQGAATAQKLAEVAANFEKGLTAAQQGIAQGVLDIACAIARQVVRRELRTDAAALQPVIAEALGSLVSDGRPIAVRLHPDDVQALGPALKAEFPDAALQWIADPEVAPGDCLIEQAGTLVDGRLERRWLRAIAPLGREEPWNAGSDDAAD